jgi:hypothetical protein
MSTAPFGRCRAGPLVIHTFDLVGDRGDKDHKTLVRAQPAPAPAARM